MAGGSCVDCARVENYYSPPFPFLAAVAGLGLVAFASFKAKRWLLLLEINIPWISYLHTNFPFRHRWHQPGARIDSLLVPFILCPFIMMKILTNPSSYYFPDFIHAVSFDGSLYYGFKDGFYIGFGNWR